MHLIASPSSSPFRFAQRARRRSLLAVLLSLIASASALAAGFQRPAFQVLRQNEDWSVLAAKPADAPADPFDGMKYVALGEDGKVWMSFGGQLRARAEAWHDFNFGATAAGVENDDLFLLGRALFHLDLRVGKPFRLFVQGKSALIDDRDLAGGKRAIDRDELDLQNAFVELAAPAGNGGRISGRIGRQELLFGKQRLVSPLDWVNTRRTFDGASAQWKSGTWTVAGFLVEPVVVDPTDFNEGDDTTDFSGIYSTWKPNPKATLDLYVLAVDRDRATLAGVTGASERETYGLRLEATGRWADFELEGAWQSGDLGSSEVEAYMVSAVLGFSEKQHRLAPRIAFGVDYATGDERPNDGRVETFDQLFPLAHAYLGYMDFVGRQNIVDLHARYETKLCPKSSIQLDWHTFSLATRADGLYGVGGTMVRKPNGDGSKSVGDEIDLVWRFTPNPHLLLELGLGRFSADDYLSETGAGEDVDFAYLTTQYTF